MAIKGAETASNTTTTSGAGRQRKEADGWLNLRIRDASGVMHNIQAFVPLYNDVRLHRAILNKGVNPDVEITIIGSVNIVDKNAPEIEL